MLLATELPVKIVSAPGPNTAEWVTAWATVFIGLGVIVAMIGIALERRHRHTESAARFMERWNGDTMSRIRGEMRQYQTTTDLRIAFMNAFRADPPKYHEFLRELTFFEELGVLERHKGVSLSLIRSLLGSVVCDRWRIWRPSVEVLREVTGHKTHLEHFERLAGLLETPPSRRRRLRTWCARIVEG